MLKPEPWVSKVSKMNDKESAPFYFKRKEETLKEGQGSSKDDIEKPSTDKTEAQGSNLTVNKNEPGQSKLSTLKEGESVNSRLGLLNEKETTISRLNIGRQPLNLKSNPNKLYPGPAYSRLTVSSQSPLNSRLSVSAEEPVNLKLSSREEESSNLTIGKIEPVNSRFKAGPVNSKSALGKVEPMNAALEPMSTKLNTGTEKSVNSRFTEVNSDLANSKVESVNSKPTVGKIEPVNTKINNGVPELSDIKNSNNSSSNNNNSSSSSNNNNSSSSSSNNNNNNEGTFAEPFEDGAVVLSIPVPSLPRANSAPDLLTLTDSDSKDSAVKNDQKKEKMEMTKEELIKKYRIHIFVTLIFLITVISVSLSWYYRNVALQALHSSQAIFFNPRNRELTLADPSNSLRVRGFLARDIPPWQLPLHCPIVMGDNPHSKECVWKNNAILRVQHFGSDGVQCYNVSWESLDPMHVPHDCFDVSTDLWYGPSNKSDSTFPIKGQFGFQPVNYSIGNNGLFSSVVDFYWLSSGGAALRVNGNDPIQVAWNQSGNDELCILSNYTGPLYHQKYAVTSAFMNYTLCNGLDILTTHKFMQSMFAPPQQVHYPPKHVFQGPHWSLKGAAKTLNVTQEHVLDLAVKVNDYGFQGNKITVDGNWQRDHGDLVFDSQRFSNWTNVTDSLELYDCQLTLCVSPYFQYRSDNFHQGVAKSMFVKDAGGEVTGLTNFQGGLAAILDVFKPDGTKWYLDKLKADLSPFGIKSYRLTYGRQAWLPYKPHFYSDDATPNMYRKMLTEALSFVSDSLTVEHTSDSRHVTSLLPVATELGVTGDKLCLNGAIETALTLGLLGYPFVMADGFTITSKALVQRFATDGRPPRELYIRWLQLVTFFPSFQFSIAPWEYDEDVVSMATNLSARHEALVIPELQNKVLKQEVGLGYPILRPVWWLDPKNITVHKMEIKDEFLVGNNLLVAPVLCQGETSRDIYVPPGVWEDLHDGSFILGPNTLRNYRILPHEIAVFVRREVVGDRTRPEL